MAALALRTPKGKRAYRRLVVLSGRRGGKTLIGGLASGVEASEPNTIGWACAPSYPELHDYVIPAIRSITRNGLEKPGREGWSVEHQELRLLNGSIIQFRSLDDPERGRGPGLHWLWIDEGRKVSELAYDTILPALTDKPGIVFVTSSVNQTDWLYRRLWEPAQAGKPGYWGVKYKTSDNPSIDPDEIEEARSSMTDAFFRQEYEADFVHFEGAVYQGLIDQQIIRTGQERSVIPEWPEIRPTRQAIMGLDPGVDHPFGAVLMVAAERGLVVCGEHYGRHLPIAQHVTGIRGIVRGLSPRYAYDRSAAQTAIELAQHGIFAEPAENDVLAGIRRVESWLVRRQMWFLESAVPKTIGQMRGYHWAKNTDKHGASRKEHVTKKDDEGPDCLRYGCQLWPELPTAAETRTGRDPESVPPACRWGWEREQRIAAQEASQRVAEGMFG